METGGSASREALSGHDTPSSVSSSARRHCQYRSFAQRPQWRREDQHRSFSHLCSPRPASHGILRAQSKVTVTGLAQCCLTPRSSGAPTAGHQRPAGGTRYIFSVRAKASCRRGPLSSNVRPRTASPFRPRRFGGGCMRSLRQLQQILEPLFCKSALAGAADSAAIFRPVGAGASRRLNNQSVGRP